MTEITLRQLMELCACSDALILFKRIFGDKTSVKSLVKELHKKNPPLAHYTGQPAPYDKWEVWLLVQELPLTKAMIENGANVRVADSYAFRHTLSWGRFKFAKLLLEKGIKKKVIQEELNFLRKYPRYAHEGTIKLLEQYV